MLTPCAVSTHMRYLSQKGEGESKRPLVAPMRLHQPSCGSRSSTGMEVLKALAYLTPKGEGDSSGQEKSCDTSNV